MLGFYAIYHLLDGNKSVSCGAMRGLSKQAPATILSAISYYVISIPFQYLFGFHLGLGVVGLWGGQMVGALFHLTFLCYLLFHSYNWL